MKSLAILQQMLLENLGAHCSVDITRDSKTVAGRVEDEGDSFLTITLPVFGKALERALDLGHWPDPSELPNYRHRQGLPVFLRGFLIRIFSDDGTILDNPDADCIWAIRQYTLFSAKIERDCTPERVNRAFDEYVLTERALLFLPGRIDRARREKFLRMGEKLFGGLFRSLDNKIANFELIPSHGPGSVADRLNQSERRTFPYWSAELDSVFPAWRYTQNTGHTAPAATSFHTEPDPVRVISVPKTQKTPRIIAMEPSYMQYAQQGLKREIYEWVRKHPLAHVLGFQDQTRNRELARQASMSQKLSTLDLSEASDRVHWILVDWMVRKYPHLRDFLWATRSRLADVPGHGVMPIQKYASMGSALTFPVEAIVFTILAACGLESAGTLPRITPSRLRGVLSVYGDDIIVPVSATASVIDWLEHFGAKVNQSKSFWNGKFRESCGAEFYDGHDVSVVRIRHDPPGSRKDATKIAAYTDLHNRLVRAGLWTVAGAIGEDLDTLFTAQSVHVDSSEKFPGLHRVCFVRPRWVSHRFHPDYHRYEVRTHILRGQSQSVNSDGPSGLLEWFHTALNREIPEDPYSGQERPTSFNIKRGWAQTDLIGWAAT